MYEYIFTFYFFDKLHDSHIEFLENMQNYTKKIILGLYDNNNNEKIKNISNIDSYNDRKNKLQKYVYDIFRINDMDPTKAIQEYLLKNFTDLDEIKNINIIKNNDITNLYYKNFDYNNFEIFGTNFNNLIPHSDLNRENSFWVYDKKERCCNIWDTIDLNICKNHELIDNSNIEKQKYRCLCNSKCIILPVGIRSKHLYKDDNYIIYNERDYGGNLFEQNGNGRMISKINKQNYKSTMFDMHNNNSTNNGGSEDYRYILFNEELYIIMNGLPKNNNKRQMYFNNIEKNNKNNNKRQMYLYNIKKNEICKLYIKNYDLKNIEQKNWTPYVYKNELYFIYSFCELCIVKLKNVKSGECELVYGSPSLFTNKTVFGGTNLCHWKNDLFIGFAHIRNPWYSVPMIFDAKNYKYITTTIPIKIKTPFEIDLSKDKIVQFPYYFAKCKEKYELSISHQDFYSIKYEINTDKIDTLFTNLLNHKNWCFMTLYENNNFPGIDNIKRIMPIQYLPYSNEISETKLRDLKNKKLSLMNYLLDNVIDIMDENNIPYYLDCGTLLGFIRENGLMEKDTDIDVTIHLSYWNKLNSIDFTKYKLQRTRTISCKKKGYIISVKIKNTDMYCDIYANPAFPQLDIKNINNKNYFIPKNSDLYLTQLYGNWNIPSGKHAEWPSLFYGKLITGPYSKYWDLDFEIKLDPIPAINKKNLNKYYWNNYYKTTNHDIIKHSSFAEFVYKNYCKDCKYILDLGAGNCRDSIFFSNKNIQVTAVDYNGHLNNNYTNLTLVKKDVELFLSDEDLTQYNLVYMRWFLHAMPYEKAENIFKLSTNILEKGQKICIEVRSINDKTLIKNSIYDEEDLSYKTTHKRWLYGISRLDKLIMKYNVKKIYMEEGYFSPNTNTETNNPLIIRCIIEIM